MNKIRILSNNFIVVKVKEKQNIENKILKVEITGIEGQELLGKLNV